MKDNGGSARGYQESFVPLARMAVPVTTWLQPRMAVYLYIAAPEANVASAADRVFRIAMALVPPPAGACRCHPWCRSRSLTTAQRAGGGNPGQDDPDAAGVLDLDDPGRRRASAPDHPVGWNPAGGHAGYTARS